MPLALCAAGLRNTCTSAPGCHCVNGVNCITCPFSVTCVVPLTDAPFCDTWSAVCTLDAFIASLMYNTRFPFSGTPVAPFPGCCDTTAGAVAVPAVVNWLWKFANALPDRSVTALVTSTVIVLETGNPYGVNVTTRLSAEVLMDAPSALPFASKPKLLVLIVAGFNDSEKVSTTTAFGPIPVAPFCGVNIVTTGAVVFEPVPVENVLENPLLAFPERSNTPEVTCTVTIEFPGNGESGVNVSTVPVTSKA